MAKGATRGFSEKELAGRVKAIQAAMVGAGADIMLLTDEHNIRYFSGFFTPFWQSPTRPWFLLVPADGRPVAVIPEIGAPCMAKTWITDIRTWPSPHPEDDGISLLAATITELAGDSPTVGLPRGRETVLRMPLDEFDLLRARLANAGWTDVTPALRRLRAVKSEAEIAKIRMACHAASRAFTELPGLIRPGMSGFEAFRTFRIACLDEGADDVAYLSGGAGPGGYDDIISPPADRRLADGDVLILDTGCRWDGYFCDFDRNFAIGSVATDVTDAYAILWDATEAGLQAVRPGATCAELFGAMDAVLSAASDPQTVGGNVGRLGHGLGMQLTEYPSITPSDETVLESGMVITLEPGFAFAPGRMMVHEENLVVREDGAELLSVRAPRTLPVIG